MGTLVIRDVNLEDLELQRQVLNDFLFDTTKPIDILAKDALTNVLAMLDDWSDEIYFMANDERGAELPVVTPTKSALSRKQMINRTLRS